jgi:transcriptional regulator with XRE-family HTH domain
VVAEDETSFAHRLRTLRETIRRPDGSRYSLEDMAAGVREYTGDSCSKQYVSLLLSGKSEAPSQLKIEGLASFFGVPAAYFFDDRLSKQMQEDLRLGAAMREAGIRGVAARMLTEPALREAVLEAAKRIQDTQSSDPSDPESIT